jgi:excinuclease ABC subunit C
LQAFVNAIKIQTGQRVSKMERIKYNKRMPDLLSKIKDLPQKPGVYIYKDVEGAILYVGKANRLKNRVASYFRKDGGKGSSRLLHMISKIADMDYVVTDNEVESLILENNFIKKYQPKYNVRMRDDKNYLFIKINLGQQIPTIEYDRKTEDKTARYFGPYTSSLSARETLRMLRRVFPYCSCEKVGQKPCFFYHIQKCPGVCIGKISPEEYRTNYIDKIIRFLEGRQTEVLKDLQVQMKTLAARKQYEKAARIRDQIFALNRVLERQKLVYPGKVNQDIFSVHMDHVASINLFIVRDGKLMQKENFILENAKQASVSEVLESFLPTYYLDASNLPREVMIQCHIDEEALKKVFEARANRKIKISAPTRGEKVKLMNLGIENAKQYLEAQSDKKLLEEARLVSALKELQRVLELKEMPARIECFDISNIQGTNAVGSMVVFDFGRALKSDYRKFKIKTKDTPDDFAMMKEMLARRLARSAPSTLNSGEQSWPMPNLIIIDGGKGQLSTAVDVLKSFNLNLPIIGLAKRLEEIFLPGKSTPIMLPQNSIALFLLQRIRDEAHRFAITYHRKLRSNYAITSLLDSIGGVGPAKKKALLQRFGSIQKIREANLTEIANIVGSKLAEKIKASI